jgi:TolB-like protein/Tfp pilus assembly protein PilF
MVRKALSNKSIISVVLPDILNCMSPSDAAGAPGAGHADQPGDPTASEIRAAMEQVLASRLFARSPRMARFLSFAVEHALAGTGGALKEYLVGVEVFDRKQDYDPRIDPIVRVEARRLRAKLKGYYASAGKTDTVIVQFPKGAYAPVFRTRTTAPAARRRTTKPRGAYSSIAVLPLANLTSEAAGDYFSDGLTEELIHLLTRVEGLRVVAWHSAAQLRGHEHDLAAVRDRLKVDSILKGAVRRTPTRIRVTVQLIATDSGAVMWSEMYDREMGATLAIEEEIAQAIATTLRPALALVKPSATRPAPKECYNLCLQGRYHANMRTAGGLRKSAECFAEAVRIDPTCDGAQAGLASALTLLSEYGLADTVETMPQAEAAALRALDLDPQSAEALSTLAFIRSLVDWKWREAEALYRRAISLNPGYAKAHHWYAVDFLALLGRFDEALREVHIARDLDPLSMIIHEGYAYIHALHRDYQTALDSLRQIVALEPGFIKGYSSMGRVLSLMGRYPEAIQMFEAARKKSTDVPSIVAALGQTLGLAGQTEQARQCLKDLESMAQRAHVPSTCFAMLHLGLGERARTLDWLEKAAERHEIGITIIKIHPVYDPLRGEPRFARLLERAGF